MTRKYTYKNRCKTALQFIGEFAACLILCPIARRLYGKRKIWLISERGDDARDNGFYFFRWLRENHPEQESYYVIDRCSSDRTKLEAAGNLVNYRSVKHYLLFLGAEKLISTHVMGMSPNRTFFLWLQRRTVWKPYRGKTVFLQHGITKDRMPEFFRENAWLDLFLCGAEKEYNYVKEQFHYPPEAVQYTGFARFDTLRPDVGKRQLLIMPTWRVWLRHAPGEPRELLTESDFLHSWNHFLNSARLKALLQQYDLTVCFYPHHQMQPYADLFCATGERIRVADCAREDIQQLLRESALMITDYSSVAFDFAYLRKPVLYYQFDEADYREHHYAEGYFHYRKDGFGQVVTEEAELLEDLEKALVNACIPQEPYARRMEDFFPRRDTENCRRIYQAIEEMR